MADLFESAERYLNRLTIELNDAVLEVQKQMCTDRMGATMVGINFEGRDVYTCNVGDSRAYLFRNGQLLQLSVDHVEKRPGSRRKKAPLTQHIGIDPEEVQIEPYIGKNEIKKMIYICFAVTD